MAREGSPTILVFAAEGLDRPAFAVAIACETIPAQSLRMPTPLFSIVVPTRNRAHTLASCLTTCLAQNFDNYEIVVCDNHSFDQTVQVVEALASRQIVYVRAPQPLAMSANWELALSKTNGTYVMFIGDDDGLMPFALRELARLIGRYDEPSAVHWRCGHYHWPTFALQSEANYLAVPLTRSIHVHSGRDQLLRAARQEISYDKLPNFYYAAVHRRLIDNHIELAGRMFVNLYPDVYSAYVFAYLCESYVSSDVPMHIAGLSGMSNGVAAVLQPRHDKIASESLNRISSEFTRLGQEGGFVRHPAVPNCDLLPAYEADSFHYAKDLLFPTDLKLDLDRKQMTMKYIAAIPTSDADVVKEIRSQIRSSLADEPALQSWFDQEVPNLPSYRPFEKPSRLGFDGSFLLLNTVPFGVTNIAEAVQLAVNILQIPEEGIVFDLPSVAELNAVLERSQFELNERTGRLETLSDLLGVRTRQSEEISELLAERTKLLDEISELLAERTHRLESMSELLIERTHRLEKAIKELSKLRSE